MLPIIITTFEKIYNQLGSKSSGFYKGFSLGILTGLLTTLALLDLLGNLLK